MALSLHTIDLKASTAGVYQAVSGTSRATQVTQLRAEIASLQSQLKVAQDRLAGLTVAPEKMFRLDQKPLRAVVNLPYLQERHHEQIALSAQDLRRKLDRESPICAECPHSELLARHEESYRGTDQVVLVARCKQRACQRQTVLSAAGLDSAGNLRVKQEVMDRFEIEQAKLKREIDGEPAEQLDQYGYPMAFEDQPLPKDQPETQAIQAW